jgi:DNA-binding transcriptional MerR regulator
MFEIGEFSRFSRVSVRLLHHYDQLGLLTPSQTDPFTGYRYYSAEQLSGLNRIIALRDLGFSLEQIAGMLDEDLSTNHDVTRAAEHSYHRCEDSGHQPVPDFRPWLALVGSTMKNSDRFGSAIKRFQSFRNIPNKSNDLHEHGDPYITAWFVTMAQPTS